MVVRLSTGRLAVVLVHPNGLNSSWPIRYDNGTIALDCVRAEYGGRGGGRVKHVVRLVHRAYRELDKWVATDRLTHMAEWQATSEVRSDNDK
jgi:hypothetical protein